MKQCLGCFKRIKDDLDTCPHCGYVEGTPSEEAIHMEPGTILSERYIIGKVIGYGGFGVTYIGWDKKLEMKVAIKEYLPSEFSTRIPGRTNVSIFSGVKKEQYISGLNKFVDEAKRLSKFQQEDGIVTIYDCIAENDTAYIIMEYLEGETLAERLKREKTIPEKEAIAMMTPLMKSLVAVHNEGIIHRDIAPDNIFLTKDGKVKLIDFGAARFATTAYSRSLTIIIKPGYSAEEQYRSNSDQGPCTDVYSVAATLYKMLTGETPPDALERRAKVENVKKDILQEPHKINKSISRVAENAVLNALNIRIEDRTQTIQKLASDLTATEPVPRIYGKIKAIDLYRLPIWLKILIPSLLVVFLTFGTLIAAGVIRINTLFKTDVAIPEGYTVVPYIEGLSTDEATEQLSLSKLNYTTGGSVTSEYVEANLIVFQNPEGGRIIPINSLVELTVCRGMGVVEKAKNGISTVPVFVWSEEQTAVKDFETAGLKTRIEYVFDENVSAGQVIRATDVNGNELVAGKELTEGSTVVLYVSKGAEGFLMPNVVGMPEVEAKSILEQAGLVVNVTHIQNTEIAEGTVFEQSINPDTNVTLGTRVEISVASATPVTETTAIVNPGGTMVTPVPGQTATPKPTNKPTTAPADTETSVPTNAPTSAPKATDTPTPVPTATNSPTPTPPAECEVVFDSRWGNENYEYGDLNSYIYKYGQPIYDYQIESAFAPTYGRNGYECTGWECDGTFYSRDDLRDLVVTCDMTFYPVWERDPDFPFYTLPKGYPDYEPLLFTVTFDSNGGDAIESMVFEYMYDDHLDKLPIPAREGYRFNGWLCLEDGNIYYEQYYPTIVYSDLNFVAQWA